MREPTAPQPSTEAGYETSDLNARQIAKLGIIFAVVLGVIVVLVTFVQYGFMGRVVLPYPQPPSLNPPANVTLPAEPRFEAEPGTAFDQLITRQTQQLHSYGWVNQNAGIVHIPIERAIDLQLQRGLPVAPEDANKTFDDAGNELPSSSSSGRMMEQIYP